MDWNKIKQSMSGTKWLLVSDGIVFLVIVVIFVAFVWQFTVINNLKNTVAINDKNITARLEIIESGQATTTRELTQRLIEQQNRAESFEDAINDINDSVGTLEKLSQTDKELLQKYSRVYFLSENYVPMRLSNIPEKYVLDPKRTYQFHSMALSFLKKMIDRANSKDGIDLKISSAYRSFKDQTSLKANYLTTYGSGSNQFSADQGYSEHQLGTTVDLVAMKSPTLTIAFENTEEFKWLQANAYKYGFVLSYPKNNAYYQYEPWHWRFVGVELATMLHDLGKNFADLDQREIDKYLVSIFD